jgi:hypothetical protein
MGLVTHEWTHESDSSSTKVRSNHSGYYGIGDGLAFSAITERLTVDGNVKVTGDLEVGVGQSSGSLGLSNNVGFHLYSTGYVKSPYPFFIGSPTLTLAKEIPFSVASMQNNQGGTATTKSHTGRMQIGNDDAANMGLDENKIQARLGSAGQSSLSDAVAAKLEFNTSGGDIDLSASGDTTAVKGHMTVAGNTTITGNLTVSGTATSLDTQQITAEDPFILINSAGTAQDAGIEVERTGLTNVSLRWNNLSSTTGQWEFTNDGSTFTAIGSGSGSGTITALNNQTANRLVTIGSTTTELDGEANLTFTGTTLAQTGGVCTLTGTGGDSGTTALSVVGGTTASSNAAVSITGHLEATTKSFNIPHPLLNNKRLVYGSLEGPEHGMYQRGSFDIEDGRRIVAIDLPVYWSAMTFDDYTINLTTYGDYNVWISNRDENGFWVETNAEKEWSFDWTVIAGRKDAKLVVEPDA